MIALSVTSMADQVRHGYEYTVNNQQRPKFGENKVILIAFNLNVLLCTEGMRQLIFSRVPVTYNMPRLIKRD